MACNSGPDEGPRKKLDEIRRELDAEYGFIETEAAASGERAAADDRHQNDGLSENVREAPPDRRRAARRFDDRADPRSRAWKDRDEIDFERHQLAMGQAAAGHERPRASGYILAALIGGVAGQALLLGFFFVMQHRLSADVLQAKLAGSPRVEATAPAPAPSKEELAESIVSIPPDDAPAELTSPESSSATKSSSMPSSSPAASPSSSSLPPRPTPKASSTVASVTVTQPSRLRASEASPGPASSPARRPSLRDASDVAEAQTRLRAALNEWLRTTARGGAPVETTEPVIVLGADGRTAKTYVSVSSPIGVIPREQRWQLDAGGWILIDDRQAGLPRPAAGARGK